LFFLVATDNLDSFTFLDQFSEYHCKKCLDLPLVYEKGIQMISFSISSGVTGLILKTQIFNDWLHNIEL